jgi:hypothetical protein
MSKTEGVIYRPPHEGLPYLAVVFMDDRILACQPTSSPEEGEAILASIMRDLPAIVVQANRDQDEEDERNAPRS